MRYVKTLLPVIAAVLVVVGGLAGCADNVSQASMNTYNPPRPTEPPPTAYGGS